MTKIDFKLDYYDILQIVYTSNEKEIRSAYRKRAREIHPDKSSKVNAAELFHEISYALEILTDKSRRKIYDDYWRENREEYKRNATAKREKEKADEIRRKREEEERLKKEKDRIQREKEAAAKKKLDEEKQRAKEEKDAAEKKRNKEEKLKLEQEQKRIKKEKEETLRKMKEEEDRIRLEQIAKEEKDFLESRRLYAASGYHRFLIGKKGENIKNIRQNYNRVEINFKDDYIYFHGPAYQISLVKEEMKNQLNDLIDTIAFDELNVEELHMKSLFKIVGNISKKNNIIIRMPTSKFGPITFEGSPQGVDTSKKEIEKFIHNLENQISRDIEIPSRLHGYIIGKGGRGLHTLLEGLPDTRIDFPKLKLSSNIVKINGEKNNVTKTIERLEILTSELDIKFHELSLKLDSVHFMAVTKQCNRIAKKTNTKIKDLPLIETLQISGNKENTLSAKKELLDIQYNLADLIESVIFVDFDIYTEIKSSGDLKSITCNIGKVNLKYDNNKFRLEGPSKQVSEIRGQLASAIDSAKKATSCQEQLHIPDKKTLDFILGFNSENIKKLAADSGARISVMKSKMDKQDYIKLVGTDDQVESALSILRSKLDYFLTHSKVYITITPAYFDYLIENDSKEMKNLQRENIGVSISFQNISTRQIVLEGPTEKVQYANKTLLELFEIIDNYVSIEFKLSNNAHKKVFENDNSIQEMLICRKVKLICNNTSNCNISLNLTGEKNNCIFAKKFIMDLAPISKSFEISSNQLHFLEDEGGANLISIIQNFNVELQLPLNNSSYVKLIGIKTDISNAIESLMGELKELEKNYIYCEKIVCKLFVSKFYKELKCLKNIYKVKIDHITKNENSCIIDILKISGDNINVEKVCNDIIEKNEILAKEIIIKENLYKEEMIKKAEKIKLEQIRQKEEEKLMEQQKLKDEQIKKEQQTFKANEMKKEQQRQKNEEMKKKQNKLNASEKKKEIRRKKYEKRKLDQKKSEDIENNNEKEAYNSQTHFPESNDDTDRVSSIDDYADCNEQNINEEDIDSDYGIPYDPFYNPFDINNSYFANEDEERIWNEIRLKNLADAEECNEEESNITIKKTISEQIFCRLDTNEYTTILNGLMDKYNVLVYINDDDDYYISLCGMAYDIQLCETKLLTFLSDLKTLITEDIEIEEYIQIKILGEDRKGAFFLIEKFGVVVKFYTCQGLVTITGEKYLVLNCKEHLLQIVEENALSEEEIIKLERDEFQRKIEEIEDLCRSNIMVSSEYIMQIIHTKNKILRISN